MTQQHDAVIVGGSLSGPLMALALASGGLRVALVDAMPKAVRRAADFDGRAYALSASSVRLLTALGIWPAVADKAEAIRDIKVSDGRAGEGASNLYLHFDHRELEEGPFGHMLEDRFLRIALMDALQNDPLIQVVNGATVTSIADGLVATTARKKAERSFATRLVIGCDGRRSSVAQMAGIGRMGWDYKQTSIVCAVAHEKPHQGVAHQFFTPAGPLAILPLPGNKSSIVWTEKRARAARIMACDEAGFLDELRPVFGSFLGDLALDGARFSYPLGLTLAKAFCAPGVALVGDAAHGIHPLAGQGLNLGMRDIAALAEVVVEARRRGEDIGALNVLERYQQWRRFDTAGLAVATDTINRLFSNDNPLLRAGRDLGLAAVNAMPGLRRRLMREAAGLTGDMPRLLDGRAL